MGKKHGRKTVKIGPPASPEDFAAEAAGKAIRFSQRDTLAHMLETAIELWFKDSDPLSIHLIGEAVYRFTIICGMRGQIGMLNYFFLEERIGGFFLKPLTRSKNTSVISAPR